MSARPAAGDDLQVALRSEHAHPRTDRASSAPVRAEARGSTGCRVAAPRLHRLIRRPVHLRMVASWWALAGPARSSCTPADLVDGDGRPGMRSGAPAASPVQGSLAVDESAPPLPTHCPRRSGFGVSELVIALQATVLKAGEYLPYGFMARLGDRRCRPAASVSTPPALTEKLGRLRQAPTLLKPAFRAYR